MNTRRILPIALLLLYTPFAFADASYQTSMQITGGSLIDTIKSSPFTARLAKNLLAPTNTLTVVHGNQKARITKESTEITDIDKGVIIRIDNEKKTYTITTFAQMRQMFQQMPEQMKQMQAQLKQQQADAQAQMKQAQDQMPKSDIKTTFDVKVNNTGVTKIVNGISCQEQVVVMTMTVSDPSAPPPPPPAPGQPPTPTSMAYTMTNDIWIAPDPPQLKEIQDFDIRMAQKMMEGVDVSAFATQMKAAQSSYSNPGFAGLFGSQPGAAEAMAQMGKEMAKLKGTHVMEVMSMGGVLPPGSTPPPPPPPAPSGSSMAGQVASDTATSTAQGESGKLGVFGSSLSNSMIGAFKKKKAATPPPAATPAATPTTPAGPQTVTMMQMTTQESNFTNESVPASAFDIPAGYKKVPNPFDQMSTK